MNGHYGEKSPAPHYWNSSEEVGECASGLYIAISGNTGSGKSTLVSHLAASLQAKSVRAIGINERALHHPLLPLMFTSPENYALGVQLNFVVQRHLMLKRHLDLGYVVVIERSHLDDPLFVLAHEEEGNIKKEEASAYREVFEVLSRRLPEPDFYVFLDSPAELSLQRLSRAAESGERPEEFPDPEARIRFVTRWAQQFREHYSHLVGLQKDGVRFQRTAFRRFEASMPTKEIANLILGSLRLGAGDVLA